MSRQQRVTNLEELLDRLNEAARGREHVSLGAILEVVGRRSFGPLLLLAGVIASVPLVGDIPGVPTTVGIFVLLVAGQLVFRRECIWLPQWLLRRSVTQDKLCRALQWSRKPARFMDRFIRPRLTFLTHSAGIYSIAVICSVIAAAMPLMELVPFTAQGAGAAITAFGLSIVAHDGLIALLALVFTAVTFAFIVHSVL